MMKQISMRRRGSLRNMVWLAFGLIITTATAAPLHAPRVPLAEVITIDRKAPGHPFPHFWEMMFGSGRAILTLRESYRNDLRATKRITDFRYVRFHAILHDEVG